jgi:hypothetical protein
MSPQFLPCAAHVVGVQPQTPGVPPPPQVWGSVQVFPHVPQLAASVFVLTHVPPQNVCPLGQVQTPPWQERPPVQTWHATPLVPHC